MPDKQTVAPDRSSIGSAAFRAMHVLVDPPPHVFEDELGLRLANLPDPLQLPAGMDPQTARHVRASIVARARFIEDLVSAQCEHGVRQYVILGAGLDTFAQRRPELASRLRVFEVDQPGPQAWKRQRLIELGFSLPDWLRLVPVDFDAGGNWWDELLKGGLEANLPAIVASTGVSMYLSQDAIATTLRHCATLAPGSTLVMSFLLPQELLALEDQPRDQALAEAAQVVASPAFSVFSPQAMLILARDAGFKKVQHVSAADLTQRYLAGRPDNLRASSYQDLLVATT